MSRKNYAGSWTFDMEEELQRDRNREWWWRQRLIDAQERKDDAEIQKLLQEGKAQGYEE